MRINTKRIRLALRSPSNFLWSVRHVLRNSPVGQIDRLLLNGYSFRPNLISINITSRCNLRCEMCMQPRGAEGDDASTSFVKSRRELTPEEWRRVIDQAAPARPAFYFSGGEPLLYKGLPEILRHIKKRQLIAALVTNATALARNAEELVDAGVDNITISLDGPEAVHDRIRGVPGTFRRAMEGIRALQQAKARAKTAYPTIKVNCVITPESFESLEETVGIVHELGIDELNLQHPIFDTPENVDAHNRVFAKAMACGADDSKRPGEFYPATFTPEQFDRLAAILGRIHARGGEKPRVLFFPPVNARDWRGYYLDLRHPFPRRCTAPWTMMRLLADGTFEPCLHYVVGNVLETPLWELWNNESMRQFRRALRRHELFPACVRCCYRCY